MSTDASAFTPAPQSPTNGHSRRVEQLPGPKGLPLLGNLFQLDPRRLHLVLEGWAREHGSVYAFWAGPKPTIVIGIRGSPTRSCARARTTFGASTRSRRCSRS